MSPLWYGLVGLGLILSADAEKPVPLRYLRPGNDGFVLESEVLTTPTPRGAIYVTRTVHGDEKLILTLHTGERGEVRTAEVVLEKGKERKRAFLDLRGTTASLKRGGATDLFKPPAHPVVTSAPDWSDIFSLVRRYNADRGGKQEFTGLWIHPAKPHQVLTFAIERAGSDKVRINDKPVELTRYQVRLRRGDYLVWVRPDGVVCKLIAKQAKAMPIVLEGYEEATSNLGMPAK